MQLPRVVIAAVFFVIGALIAIPALMKTTGQSRASGAPTTTQPTTPTTSPDGTSPTPTRTTTTPSPTRPTTTPPRTTPPTTPSPTRTTAPPPVQPLTITIGNVQCPGRTVEVTVRNTGSQNENFSIERNDDSPAIARSIGPGATRSVTLRLREDRSTRIQVTWKNEAQLTRTRKANCSTGRATPSPTRTALPRTGPDDAVMWARAATGGAAMITGLIIFWYGGIWPRRRDSAFPGRKGD